MEFTFKIEEDRSGFNRLVKASKTLNQRHIRFGWINGKEIPIRTQKCWEWRLHILHTFKSTVTEGIVQTSLPDHTLGQTINKIRYGYNGSIRKVFMATLNGLTDTMELNRLATEFKKDYYEASC